MKIIRWAVLGAGSIARKFAKGLKDCELYAVGARSQQSADAFADEFGIAVRHTSYQALVEDEHVDAIYVATPHSFHKEHTLLCLSHGKAVLCEKPFALNLKEAQEMVAFAREKKVFLMEAMWTRFLPHMRKVAELIAQNAIGDVRMLQADFGFRMSSVMPEHRLFNPELGGGALLDVGIYPVALAHQLFGAPKNIKSFANLGETQVDEEAAMLFQHEQGQLSLLSTAIRLNTLHEAIITGTQGRITIEASWWQPTTMKLEINGQDPQILNINTPLNGYNYEALEVNNCLRQGKLESDTMPLNETLEIMKTLDALRNEWGLVYPGDKA